MRPTSSDAKLRPLHFGLLKAFRGMFRRSGVSIPLHFPSTFYIQADVSVYTSGSIVSSGEDRVLFS
jgi:hypothetical protein